MRSRSCPAAPPLGSCTTVRTSRCCTGSSQFAKECPRFSRSSDRRARLLSLHARRSSTSTDPAWRPVLFGVQPPNQDSTRDALDKAVEAKGKQRDTAGAEGGSHGNHAFKDVPNDRDVLKPEGVMELRNSARTCTGRSLLVRNRHIGIVSHPRWLSIRRPKEESNCERCPGMVWALPRATFQEIHPIESTRPRMRTNELRARNWMGHMQSVSVTVVKH